MPSKRDRLHRQLQRLSLEEKQALQVSLAEQIAADEMQPEVEPKQDREVIETKKEGRITY